MCEELRRWLHFMNIDWVKENIDHMLESGQINQETYRKLKSDLTNGSLENEFKKEIEPNQQTT